MKILHSSDWHLGQHFMGKSRKEEHAAFINWLLAVIEEEGIEALIIAGDIFDTGAPPSYAREMYHQLVLDMKARHCQLFVVAGNHDSVSMLNESKSLLGYLDTQVTSQANRDHLEEHVLPITSKDGRVAAWLCAVPYLRPKDVLDSVAGQSEQQKKQALQQQISDFYQQVYAIAEQKNAELDQPVAIIGTGHLTAVGGQLSESVRDLYVGSLEALPTHVFPKFDYLALGHIHRAQAINKQGNFRYSGSPIPLSFDELAREKSVVIIDTERLSTEHLSTEQTTPVIQDLFAQQDSLQETLKGIQMKSIPRFQAMISLKGRLDELLSKITQLPTPESGNLWLEVTVIADDYISDVQKRLSEVIEALPIELLRVMRKSAVEAKAGNHVKRETLAELTVADVFERAIATQLDISEDDFQSLTQLFNECLDEVQTQQAQPS
ncbi:exonuclease SbcCD subunit D C-terminal domain-containing protein [Marinomonas sp.]